jgi:transposase
MTKQEREERRDRVVELYVRENKSINQIANELKVDWSTIKRDLISRNIEI